MPIVIYKSSLGLNRDVPFLLADIGEKFISYKSGAVYRRGQVQYISPGSLVVLKPTTQVEGSIYGGWIKQFVDQGAFSVEYLPFLQTDPGGINFVTSLTSLDETPSATLLIKNIGDDPASGSSDITVTISNNTSIASASAMLVGDRRQPYQFSASGSAQIFGTQFETYDIFSASPPVLTSNIAGPYTIQAGVDDVLRIRYSNKNYPLEFINLSSGIRTTLDIANEINAVFPGLATATASPNGFLQLQGLTSGSHISIEVGSLVENSTANATLGFSTSGELAVGSNAVNEFVLHVDGTPYTIPLTEGIGRTATNIASDINAVVAGVASVSTKRVVLTSTTAGTSSTLLVGSGNANLTLGFTRGDSSTGYLGNINFAININGSNQDMVFTAGSKSVTDVVSELNGGLSDITASVDGEFVKISTDIEGSGASLTIIEEALGSTAYDQIGFDLGQSDEGNNLASGFVTLSATTGTINQVVQLSITVSLNVDEIRNNLTPGFYAGELLITTSAGAFNSPLIVPITLDLSETD